MPLFTVNAHAPARSSVSTMGIYLSHFTHIICWFFFFLDSVIHLASQPTNITIQDRADSVSIQRRQRRQTAAASQPGSECRGKVNRCQELGYLEPQHQAGLLKKPLDLKCPSLFIGTVVYTFLF